MTQQMCAQCKSVAFSVSCDGSLMRITCAACGSEIWVLWVPSRPDRTGALPIAEQVADVRSAPRCTCCHAPLGSPHADRCYIVGDVQANEVTL